MLDKLSVNRCKVAIVALFSFTGVMFRVFREAGYPIQFLLFLCGESGSFKTSLSKVFFEQLAYEGRTLTRRISEDTGVSHERAMIVDGIDNVLLFDDFSPQQSARAKNLSNENLQLITRYVGDGKTKSRSNAMLDTVRGAEVAGSFVVFVAYVAKRLGSSIRQLCGFTLEDARGIIMKEVLMNINPEYVDIIYDEEYDLIKTGIMLADHSNESKVREYYMNLRDACVSNHLEVLPDIHVTYDIFLIRNKKTLEYEVYAFISERNTGNYLDWYKACLYSEKSGEIQKYIDELLCANQK